MMFRMDLKPERFCWGIIQTEAFQHVGVMSQKAHSTKQGSQKQLANMKHAPQVSEFEKVPIIIFKTVPPKRALNNT